MIISQNKIEKLQSVKVCTSSLSAGGRREVNFLPNFQKGGELDTTSVFIGGCWERGGDFLQGGGYNFSIKNKLKPGIFNDKKVFKKEFFALSSLRIQTGKF